MRSQRILVTGLSIILILGQIAFFMSGGGIMPAQTQNQDYSECALESSPENSRDDRRGNPQFSIAQADLTGTLDPVQIRQDGILVSDDKEAVVDTATRAEDNLTIDELNGWAVSEAEIDVWNIKRIYAENGSFTGGSDPWTASLLDTDPSTRQIQSVVYNSTEENIVCTNIGPLTNAGQDIYTHFAYSEVLASQTVDNVPFAQEFYLSFRFLYASGPLDPLGDDLLEPVYLAAWFGSGVMGWNGWVWDMTSLPERNVWYERNNFYVDPTILTGDTFEFQIGIWFQNDVDVYAYYDYDDDGNGTDDGVEMAQRIEIHIDDVSLVSVSPLSIDQVEMTLHAGAQSDSITGTGETGSGTISNPSWWTENPLSIEITTNMSVSFDYRTSLTSHRSMNSSWAADPTKPGVAYSISPGQSADLSLYTYIGTVGQYENISLHVVHPFDWENVTVRNPFLSDVTASCIITLGSIGIPTSILDNLGWWEITLEAPNYAETVSVQKLDGTWIGAEAFATGNITRIQANIGTASAKPVLNTPANFSWVMPNGTIWHSESIPSGVNGVVNSSALTLGGLNTTAGIWVANVAWTNGTEIAYGSSSFGMYHSASLALMSAEYETIETDSGLTVANFLHYTDADNGDFLMEDTATIAANWSATQVNFEANLLRNWWEANFDTSIVGNGRFVVIVNASRPFYNNVSLQFTIISTHRTNFQITSVGGIPPEIGLYESYEVDMHYELQTGLGIEGAEISMTYVGPAGGLSLQTTTDDTSGDYSAFIIASESGTYTVTFRASKDYHYNGTDSFTLIVGEIDTDLTVANGTAGFVSFGRSYRLVVYYTNSTGFGLDSSTVEIANVAPAAGISFGTVTDEGNGYYSVIVTPASASTWSILIKANLTNHVTQFTTFTLTVSEVPTILTAGASGATVTIGDSHIIQLLFQDEDSNGLEGATITALNPPPEISVGTVVGLPGGYYNVDVTALAAGTYQIAFRASLANHLNSIVGFTLVVNGYGSELICLNGTADFALYGDTYKLVLRYSNTTGFGLTGAFVGVVNVIPSAGLGYAPSTDESSGYYSIILDSTSAGIFTILVRANLTDYAIQFVTFSLTVRETPTVLTLDHYDAEIAGDQTHTVLLFFEDEDSIPLEGATIDVLNPPASLTIHPFVEIGVGYYNVTIEPSEIGTFLIAFRASLVNHQSSTVGFTLIVVPAPTTLILLDGLTSDTSQYSERYVLSMIYFRTDTAENITGAQFTVTHTPDEGLSWSVSRTGDIYSLTILADTIGTWNLFITANKTAHASAFVEFTLRVVPIASSINEFTLLEALVFYRSYELDFDYLMSNGTGIGSANVTASGSGAAWIVLVEVSPGLYRATLTPGDVGEYEVVLTFTRDGFQTRTSSFAFTVIPVVIQVVDVQGLGGIEGQMTTISLRLTRADTGNPVSGVAVQFQFVTDTGPGTLHTMEEGPDGTYSAAVMMPSAVETTYLRVYVSLENYALETDYFEVLMSPAVSDTAALTRMVQNYFPFIVLLVVGTVTFAGRKAYTKRMKLRNIEAMAIKRRFDDVKSLLGVIVLHKNTGIPVYSKMMKGGFDETLVSGFVSAISTFRSEFKVEQENWRVTPISDIIRTVATDNLICAFISYAPPSMGQELRMIEFAETVGFVFDTMYTEAPSRALEDGTIAQFDAFFDDIMDGRFLREYTVPEVKSFPRKTKCIEKRIHRIDDEDGFDLDELATEMTSCGLEEARVYKIIMDAIEMGNLALANIRGSKSRVKDPRDDVPVMIVPPSESDETNDETREEMSDEDKFLEDVETLLSKDSQEKNDE